MKTLGFWSRDLKLSFFGFNIVFLSFHNIVVHHIVLLVISVGDRATANIRIINFVDNDLCRERFNVTTQFDFTIMGGAYFMVIVWEGNSARTDINCL